MKSADVERVLKAVTMVVDAGDDSVLSSQLELPETSGSSSFWVEIADFPMFWWFFMKKAVSERVSKAVVVVVCLGNSIGTCDLKTARNGALFSSVMSAGSCVC